MSEPMLQDLEFPLSGKLRWLWPRRIPLGCLSIIASRPMLGKSLVAIDIAARVTTGSCWPDGTGQAPHGSVVFLDFRDNGIGVIKSRPRAAGANLDKATVITKFITARKTEQLLQTIDQQPDCKLLAIDPIGNYVNVMSRENRLRARLLPLATYARERGIAVIFVAESRKTPASPIDLTVSGSVGLVGAARAVWHILPSDRSQDDECLFAAGKQMLCDPPAPALRFKIQGHPLVVVWGEPVHRNANGILAGRKTKC